MKMISEEIKVKSICGAANLLAAILKKDADSLKKEYGLPLEGKYCLECGIKISKLRTYCSEKCFSLHHRVTLVCSECGKIFSKTQSEVIFRLNHPQRLNRLPVKRFFCSRHCLGVYRGINYGFGAHPENVNRNKARKYNYDEIRRLRLQGLKYREIMLKTGVAPATLSCILRKEGLTRGIKYSNENTGR